MKMTLEEALECVMRGETPEQYFKRIKRIERLALERDFLEDAIDILNAPEDAERAEKKRKRLAVVKAEIERLL